MKRVLTAVMVLAFVLCLATPAFADENNFVPSISVKGAPSFVPDENGIIGVVYDADGNVVDYLGEDCLLVTSIADVASSDMIPDDAAALLLSVYNKLVSGEMVLPADKLAANLEPNELVIRDLVDISWICEDHEEMVAPDGVVFKVTLDLGVAADDDVFVLTYKNSQWNPIVDVVNNGDGTITCTFEHLCPVAFAVGEDLDSPITGELNNDVFLWTAVLTVSAVAVVAAFGLRRRENRA